MTASAVWCAGCVITAVKGFADICCKSKKGIARGVVCPKDKESAQRRKEVITSLIKVELRRS
jgi:hypothetical protein